MPHATIKEIIRSLKISASAVARALCDHLDLRHATRQKVPTLAQQLEQQPDLIAQSLRARSIKTIGVIIPKMKHHFFTSVLSDIQADRWLAGGHFSEYSQRQIFLRRFLKT